MRTSNTGKDRLNLQTQSQDGMEFSMGGGTPGTHFDGNQKTTKGDYEGITSTKHQNEESQGSDKETRSRSANKMRFGISSIQRGENLAQKVSETESSLAMSEERKDPKSGQ